MNHPDPRRVYETRLDRHRQEWKRLGRVSQRIGAGRMSVFLLGLTSLFVAELGPVTLQPQLRLAALVAVLLFVCLVFLHRGIKAAELWHLTLRDLNQEGLARLARDWEAMPVPPGMTPPPDHPYAADLGLVGKASISQLVGTICTAPGRDTLSRWLLAPSSPPEVTERQEAVSELVPLLDFREELAGRGRILDVLLRGEADRFTRWAESTPWLSSNTALVWVSRLLPLVTLPFVALSLQSLLSFVELTSAPIWIPPPLATVALLAGQVAIVLRFRGRIHRAFDEASTRESRVREYGTLFRIVSEADFVGDTLAAIQRAITVDGHAAHLAFRRLKRLLESSDARFSLMHSFLDFLLLWDVHLYLALERWQIRHGDRVAHWFSALGEADALSALAALAHDHPEWVFPTVSEDGDGRITARKLGHPLLDAGACVHNDVEIGPPGSFVMVTGSNMSGKSTLLRAVGANVVLAQAGGPVCASEMHLPAVELATNMGVQDSLVDGLSHFTAELRRLKMIEDSTARTMAGGQKAALCLLDELLRGTNTVERQAGARRILRSLLGHGAMVMVTTHDLALADAEDLAACCMSVHFDGSVERVESGVRLSFDYVLRPGLATSTNAIALMDSLGLGGTERDARVEDPSGDTS
ncbi:MAG: hypothetical protein KAJ42_00375 [Gemmatimonadetes bacterium]|nr:hypothetical protein [Gemmatimonadota bacterium]